MLFHTTLMLLYYVTWSLHKPLSGSLCQWTRLLLLLIFYIRCQLVTTLLHCGQGTGCMPTDLLPALYATCLLWQVRRTASPPACSHDVSNLRLVTKSKDENAILTCSHEFVDFWGATFRLFHPVAFLQ